MSRIAILGFGLAVLSAVAAVGSGLGYQQDWWGLQGAFGALRWAVYGGIAAALVSAIGAVGGGLRQPRSGVLWGVVGLVVAAGVIAVPLSYLRLARSVPPIHDITTDTENPPAFVAILDLRADAANPAEHGGPEIAEQQQQAYPDIVSASFELRTDHVFDAALAVAGEMGWEVVDADRVDGRIEATDTTFWFGFKDDVVIRVAATDFGSAVDVRSVSRVGRSDVGANAARIRSYLEALADFLEG